MKAVNLLFPHQLFQQHELYENGYPLYLIEEHLFFNEFDFHKTKLAFHRASMKWHESLLIEKKVILKYVEATQKASDVRVLIKDLANEGFDTIHVVDPTDNWLEKRIRQTSQKLGLQLILYENPLFINSKKDLGSFFKPEKKSFFQTSFYKQQRLKHNVLIDDEGSPVGGKWSFDGENRKKYPKGKTPPAIHFPKNNSYWKEAVSYINTHYTNNPGKLSDTPYYPIDKNSTEKWLNQFFEYRFSGFGDYEDAIVQHESILHHSVLTPMLNIGLIEPLAIVEKSLAYAKSNDIPINTLEGFVRQIIGWREFIRGMYECKGTASRKANFWGFERKIPMSFYNGTTGIEPVDDVVKKVIKTGYCHHIERLMVLGNFMLLCEFDPNEVYKWFMELFIDAYDWVMVPNVYGMSQFADGGFFATKPYISGSNYIIKMSNYKKGDWQKSWDGLFWRFMHINRDFFLKNPRLSMLVRSFDRMDQNKQKSHLLEAETFLKTLDQQLVHQ